jgi:hypothetical protein
MRLIVIGVLAVDSGIRITEAVLYSVIMEKTRVWTSDVDNASNSQAPEECCVLME